MKNNGFQASTPNSKKVVAVSVILALVLAAISAIAAFAAPTKTAFGAQLRELNADRAWFNGARLNAANFVHTSDPVKAQQYLSQYAFALRQAEAIVAGRGVNTTNNQSNSSSNSGNSSSSSNSSTSMSNNQSAAQQDLSTWLHTMRGLRDKLVALGFSGEAANSSNMAGAGVPVTGGSSSSSSSSNSSSSAATSTPAATPTTAPSTGSSSSSSNNAATSTPTATPGTGSSSSSGTSSSGVPVTGNSNSAANVVAAQHSALAKLWGNQFRDLETDRVWLNNFKSNPNNFVNSTDPAKTQQWLDQYAFALRQADAIILGRGAVNTTNNQNNSNGNNSSSSNSSSNNLSNGSNGPTTSAQQALAGWLHMMRDLQMKLTAGVNGTGS